MSEEEILEEDVLHPISAGSGSAVRVVITVVLVFLVLGLGLGGCVVLSLTGPEAQKEEQKEVLPAVRVISVESGTHQLDVVTQGRVEPVMMTQAAAEVAGRVTRVSEKFKSGGVFVKGEVMLEIDDADYVSALASAEAALADAKLMLEQEEARAEQARRDWKKLGQGEPSDLVLRKPQIVSAKARVNAAEASVGRAIRDLERTKLRAPYDSRIEKTYTDLGSYIAPGARLADLYSRDQFELRMPVTLEELGYLKEGVVGSAATLQARVAGKLRNWSGQVVRSEGMVDRNTMTTHVVMQVSASRDDTAFRFPPMGMVVQAQIKGRSVSGLTEIPRSALLEGDRVMTLTSDDTLKILTVKLARTMKETVLIASGLPDGSRVIVSPIEVPVDGMKLVVEESQQGEKDPTP